MNSGGSQSVRIGKKYLKVKVIREDRKKIKVNKIHGRKTKEV